MQSDKDDSDSRENGEAELLTQQESMLSSQDSSSSDMHFTFSGRNSSSDGILVMGNNTRKDRSDSILSQDESEDGFHKVPLTHDRRSSVQYMEEASMEASLLVQNNNNNDDTISSKLIKSGDSKDSGESSGSARSYTKIEASGRLGRRRSSVSEMILVPQQQQQQQTTMSPDRSNGGEDAGDFDLLSSSVSSSQRSLHGRVQSDRGIFQTVDLPMNDLLEGEEPASPSPTAVVSNGSSEPKSPTIAAKVSSTALEILQSYNILPELNGKETDSRHGFDQETLALHALFDGFCTPTVNVESCAAALALERTKDMSRHVPLPDQPMIQMTPERKSRIVALLQQSSTRSGGGSKPSCCILLQLPVDFSAALLRILIRLLSHETDNEYNEACFLTLPWKNSEHPAIKLTEDPAVDPDHATKRPDLQYSVARFQCTWMANSIRRDNGGANATSGGINSQSINNDTRLAVQTILSLWESVAVEPIDHSIRRLLPPLARLLGLLATAGLAPRVLRRMLSLAQSSLMTPVARLSIVRALKTAAAGASRSSLLPKAAPRHFFCFGGTSTGMQRTISGLAAWPFRNDFGMALWFRAERFDASSPVLLSVRTEDGGGVEVSIVPIEKGNSSPSSTEACTVAISIFDANSRGKRGLPAHHLLVRGGCVLLPRVWYHLAIRHTRSRLKGVFSLSTRQQVSIMLDGKAMLTESLPFPKISDADFTEESAGTSLLQSTLRRNSSHSSMNITITFGSGFEGQTGALHIFNDNVSDASFRALYEMTGGSGGLLKRTYSLGDTWDSRRSEIVRKSRVLDVHMASDDADDIVLSQRRQSGVNRKKMLAGKVAPVVDLGNGEDNDDLDLPLDLRKAAFGSKIFVTWDPRRTSGSLALELHIGAHIQMDGVYSWGITDAQDAISSTGGIQALVPLFRSFLNGDIERCWAAVAGQSDDLVDGVGVQDAAFTIIPDLLRLLSSFVQDRNDNARELLRCSGIDVIEQLLFASKRIAAGKTYSTSVFGVLNLHIGLTFLLVETLLEFRAACSHYVGLETKMFSRILFNTPLWLSGFDELPGVALHLVLLPVLSTLARINPEKVRDCVGVKDMVNILKEYSLLSAKVPISTEKLNRFNESHLAGLSERTLTGTERRHATDIIFSMVFNAISMGTSPQDLSPFLRLISVNLSIDSNGLTDEEEKTSALSSKNIEDRRRLTENACTVLFLLFQIRPVVPGLIESFAHTCGGVQGGVGWILCSMVNCQDDKIRSLGIRCLAAYLDVTSHGADLPLTLASSLRPSGSGSDIGTDVSSTVRRASSRFTRMAKGLAAMGPNARSIVLPPSKLTARVVFKLLWHLLKSQRKSLGKLTRTALLSWITDDDRTASSSLTSIDFLSKHCSVSSGICQPGYRFNVEWADVALGEQESFVGTTLRNPLAIGTVLRLLRFLENDLKDQILSDLLALIKSNRKCVSVLASLTEWQPSLFPLISDTLELVSSHGASLSEKRGPEVREDESDTFSSLSEQRNAKSPASLHRRLDLCLDLYSTLLGHLLRAGGDKSLDAVEKAASLQRVFVNGNHVLLLILSNLGGNIFMEGTLLEMGSLSAQDWKEVDLEQDSLLLKQSARLITDSILSNGTKGLELASAVRSWRSLRHLTEVIVAVVTKSGFGVVDLFDYANHKASSVDEVSSGLHGIRVSESFLHGISASEYVSFVRARDDENEREIDRHLCAGLAAQILTLLDAFIFPQSLDSSLAASQLDGLALVRNSEARLGSSQGPLLSSAIRLSFVLLALLEPCSVVFLQCASRLRCLLCWALDLLRESSTTEGHNVIHKDGNAHIDRLVLAVVLHCHRALGRCSALLSEIETASYDKYFQSREAQKKYYRRLLRVALELRDVVSTAYRGRNDALQATISTEAHEALRASLEGAFAPGKAASKESVVRDFLSSKWVTDFQDTLLRHDLNIPEQVSMDTIPLSSELDNNPLCQGFVAVEKLAIESNNLVTDFEKAIDSCFEEYLEVQRKWAETDAVRDLEYDGDTTIKRMAEKYKVDIIDTTKAYLQRRNGADNRWRAIQRKVTEPWKNETHWKLARYTDVLGRRTLLVQNRMFDDHKSASYDLILGREREKEEIGNQERLLSDVMRRNAEAFVVSESQDEGDVLTDDDSSIHLSSDGESLTDVESSTDADSVGNGDAGLLSETRVIEDQDDGWDRIDSEEFQDVDAEGDSDAWAKTFIWSDSETVVARFEPVMIVSLQTYVGGKILLTTHGLYFHQIDDEISVMTKEPINSVEGSDSKDRRWRLTRLTEIHGRRYMLRPQALELFFSDSHELLLNFPGGVKERDRFHAKLRNSCKVPMLWSPKSLNPRVIFRKSNLTELWKKRKISNFEYIMALNRMAGRSFNDLTQYPVFPWVLADYNSDTIDVTDSRVFRDLTKPIGALNPDRLAQLLERYNELESFGFAEAEKFLYGSHYSSPGIVLHYLIRQEPFTTMAIDLQSGRFDCPDRLFLGVGESWNGCLTSTSDMKELIPEFFCLPEMFLNTNKFPLGRTQSGRLVDDVVLPPWAKGSAHEFVRINRLALESEYVSQNLHHWIDLVFGYKQRGPEAEAAHNIFHHLSYEGSVDLDKIADEVDRNAAESHIQNFGQTPSQLTATEPHTRRYAAEECWKPLIAEASASRNLRCHTPSKQFANRRSEHAKGAVLKLHVLSDSVLAIYADMSIGTYKWYPNIKANRLRMEKLCPFARRELSTSRTAMKRGSAVSPSQMAESSLAIGNWSFGITLGGLAKEELRRNAIVSSGRLIPSGDMSLSTAEASALIISCGYWDETVKAHNIDASRLMASETGGHHGAVRCLGQDETFIVSGGQDSTCRVWVVDHPDMGIALSDGYVQTALGGSNDGEQLLSCCHVLWGHDSPIVCVDLDSRIDAVASGSQSGLVCIHTIRRGEFVRSFRPPALSNKAPAGAVLKIVFGKEGNLVVHMEDQGLHTYTINAVRLCSVDAGEMLNDMKICSNDEVLITGGDRCQVLLRNLFDLKVFAMLDLSRHGPIQCIALTPDELNPIRQFLFIGSDDGMITIVDEDPQNTQTDNATISF